MILNEAKQLALDLMEQNGLEDWQFQFDSSMQRFGYCSDNKKIISLSYKMVELNNETEVRDTILHEIAHALVPHEHHGEEWKRACLRIGARPERCYSSAKTVMPTPLHIYVYVCPHCKREITRTYRFHKDYACGECCGLYSNNKWNDKFILVLK